MGLCVRSMFCYAVLCVLSSFAFILLEERKLVALVTSFFCYCFLPLLQGAVGWSVACDCGISRSYSFERRHEISKNVVCATSKASDQPAHKCILIRAFASHLNIL